MSLSAALFAGFSTSAWLLCCSSAWRSCCGLWGCVRVGGGVAPHMGTHKHASGCIRRLYRVSGLFGFARSVATRVSPPQEARLQRLCARRLHVVWHCVVAAVFNMVAFHSLYATCACEGTRFLSGLSCYTCAWAHAYVALVQRSTRKESRPSNRRDCDPHTPRYMKVEALKFDPLFMTVRADSSPNLNRAYANLFDFRPNFRPAGPKPKASYNIIYIWVLRHSHIVSCVTLALTRREYSDDVSLYTCVCAWRSGLATVSLRVASMFSGLASLIYSPPQSPTQGPCDYLLAKTSCAHQRSRYTRAMYAYRRVRYAYMRRAHI